MNKNDWFVGVSDGAVFSVLSWKIETAPILEENGFYFSKIFNKFNII